MCLLSDLESLLLFAQIINVWASWKNPMFTGFYVPFWETKLSPTFRPLDITAIQYQEIAF